MEADGIVEISPLKNQKQLQQQETIKMETDDIGEISPLKNQKSRQQQNTINMVADDIIEIPPLKKPKCAILHDVIDIDSDDDSEDLVIIDEKVSKSNKGKTIEAIHQIVEVSDYTFCQPGMENFGSVSGIESYNGHPFASHNLINVDGHDSDLSYDGDGGIDIFSEDYVDVDEYALLQAHLDNVDIPPGTEAPFTWLPEYDLGLKKSTFKNSPWYDMQSDAKDSHVTDSSQPSWSLEPSNSKIQGSAMGCSNLQIKMDNVYHSSGTGLSSQLFSHAAPSKKKSAASQHRRRDLNLSLGVESSKSKRFLKSFRSKMKSASFYSKNHGLAANPEATKLLHSGKPPAATKFKSAKKAASSSSSSYHPNFKHEILRKFQGFKQFDVVNDASDHHFIHKNSSMKQRPKNWAKEIQKEWKILETALPNSIFVRVYESRMDLLRAVIIGAEGTPYHDGLFFVDVYFPSDYPNVPPLVYFHSRSIPLNPIIFYGGEICLSLLNTFSGSVTECWLPRVSTTLQVLVSIQGLVLNAKPFFIRPESRRGSLNARSLEFNERVSIQSWQTMIHIIKRPPKNYEDFVVGYFISRAHDILVACNARVDGARCHGKDVENFGAWHKCSLAEQMIKLAREFTRIGAKDCKKFLSGVSRFLRV